MYKTKDRYEFIYEQDFVKLMITTKPLLNSLSKVHEILIDYEDAERIKAESFHISIKESSKRLKCYQLQVYRKDGKTKNLARWIFGIEEEKILFTFKNNNRLDYRRENLIETVKGKVVQNRRGAQTNNKSGIRGVYWHKHKLKWAASVRHNRRNHHAGYFDDLALAEHAVKIKREQLLEHSFTDQH